MDRGPVLAFLGCGLATRIHSETLKALGDPVERHYASREPGRAEEYAGRYGGGAAHGSYEAALRDPRVGAVVVATPPAFHLELVLEALRAGKDVIVEKPPFARAADFDLVERLRGETGRRVFVAENYFYKPLAACLRRLVEERAVGELRFVHVDAAKRQTTGDWRDERALAGGGALFEGGIHWIALLSSLGREPRRALGLRAGEGPEPERSTLVSIELEGGGAVSLLYSWEVPSPLRGLRISRIYGTAGTIRFESNGLFVLAWGRKKRLRFPGLRDIAGYRSMWTDFLRALRTGEPPAYTLARARRDLELVEQAYRSAGEPAGESGRTRSAGRRAASNERGAVERGRATR